MPPSLSRESESERDPVRKRDSKPKECQTCLSFYIYPSIFFFARRAAVHHDPSSALFNQKQLSACKVHVDEVEASLTPW